MRTFTAGFALSLGALVGCYEPPGAPTTNDGGLDGDAACTAQCVSANELIACPSGERIECLHGCDETGDAHCRQVQLANGVGVALVADLGAVAWAGCSLTFDILGGIVDDDGTTLRPGGDGVKGGIGFATVNGIAVYAFDSLDIKDCTVRFGSGTKTAVVAHGNISFAASYVDGRGLGPQTEISGCGPGGSRSNAAGGGGGAGTDGAIGGGNNGAGDGSGGGGAGGTACASMHEPLLAGSSGGRGDVSNGSYGQPGAPGAALMVGALGAINIEETTFSFGGSGGGRAIVNQRAGGGGSGGTIFIEGAAVQAVGSRFFANGGNGGRNSGGSAAANGVEGVGPSTSSNDGEGRGGTASNGPGPGKYNVGLSISTGGGGAVGNVRIHGLTLALGDLVASPAVVQGAPTLK